MTGLPLALGGLALLAAALWLWFRLVTDVRLGRHRAKLFAMIGVAMALAIVALASSPGVIGAVVASLTLVAGGVWLALRVLSPQSTQQPAVAVGTPLSDFSALDERGEEFKVASLRGHPVLIKLFRGHW